NRAGTSPGIDHAPGTPGTAPSPTGGVICFNVEPNERYQVTAVGLAMDLLEVQPGAGLDMHRQLNLALVRLMEVIGETASRVPAEFRSRYMEVPWRQTVGIRNRLIHGYGRMNRYSGSSGLIVRV
ncbi:MAG: HepT-like ribonuclease domain-containing protein, partial [Thermodesulfobacteriota bacterium]